MSTPHRPLTEGEISSRMPFSMPMSHYLRYNQSSVFWRVINIACMVIVFSYIFFDVLDLNGSDFLPARYPVKSSAIVNNVLKDIERSYLPQSKGLWVGFSTLWPASLVDPVPLRYKELFRSSALDWFRDHGYRVALPRSSPSDPSPSA